MIPVRKVKAVDEAIFQNLANNLVTGARLDGSARNGIHYATRPICYKNNNKCNLLFYNTHVS